MKYNFSMSGKSVDEWIQRSEDFRNSSRQTGGPESILLLYYAIEMATKAYIPLLNSDIDPKEDIRHQVLELERQHAKSEKARLLQEQERLQEMNLPGSQFLKEAASIFQHSKEKIDTLKFDEFTSDRPDYSALHATLQDDELQVNREKLETSMERFWKREHKFQSNPDNWPFSEEALRQLNRFFETAKEGMRDDVDSSDLIQQLTDIIQFSQEFHKVQAAMINVKAAFHDFEDFNKPLHIRLRYSKRDSLSNDKQVQFLTTHDRDISAILAFHNKEVRALWNQFKPSSQ